MNSQRVIETRSKTAKKNTKADAKILNRAKSTFKMKRGNREAGGIIYIGHIPHGFYEDEMKWYFNQFGEVLATVVARSKKTGRSKGYGFVEFKDEEVAKIAAETMNNYLMFNRIIKCRYIPPEEKRGPLIERKVTAYNFPRQENRKINERQKEDALSKLRQNLYLKKTQAKIDKFKKFFQERGVNFTFQITPKSNSIKESERKTESTSSTDSESETKDGTNDEFGVLEIDESESEIYFKTPPQVKKVIKKSLNSSATPVKEFINSNNRQVGKERIDLLKKTGLEKAQKKIRQKAKVGVRQELNKKRKTQEKAEKCLKVKEIKLKKGKVKVNPLSVKNRSPKVRNK